MSRAQLFVGRLPIDVRERDVEQVFEKYGRLLRCDVKYGTGMAYAFVDYDDRRDAETSNGREHPLTGSTTLTMPAPSIHPSNRPESSESIAIPTLAYYVLVLTISASLPVSIPHDKSDQTRKKLSSCLSYQL